MSRYKPGSRISQMWTAYERDGPAAAIKLGPSLGLAGTTINKWISGWEREKRKGVSPIKETPEIKVQKEQKTPPRKLPKIAGYTADQVALLFDLRDSKERGAASMQCTRRIDIARQLKKLVKEQDTFGGGFCSITDAGLKLLKQHKEK